MKFKFTTTIFTVVLLSYTTTTIAQENKNIVKLNLSSLIFTNISLQGEHVLNDNSSVALGISYMPKRGVPNIAADKDTTGNADNFSYSGFSITPEYRYYFSGKAPKGFYAAAYFRYSHLPTKDWDYIYDDNGKKTTYKISGAWDVAVVGVMIGSQWTLGDHFTFDWWILGAGFGKNSSVYEGTGPLTASQQTSIKNTIEENKDALVVGDIDYEVTSNSVKVEIKSGLPAIRAFGLCLGYVFGN